MTQEERERFATEISKRYMDIFCEVFKVTRMDRITRDQLELLKAVGTSLVQTAELCLAQGEKGWN